MRLPQTMTDEWFMDEELVLPSLDEGSVAEFVRSAATASKQGHWVIGAAVAIVLGLLFVVGSAGSDEEAVVEAAPSVAAINQRGLESDAPADFVLVGEKRILPMDPK